MADIDPPPDAGQALAPKPFLSRLIGVFIEPGETFEDIVRKPDFVAPLILLALVSLGVAETMLAKVGISRIILHSLQASGRASMMDSAQLNQAIQRGAPVASALMQAMSVVGVLFFLLVVAGFGILILNVFFGQRARFKEVFSATCYAYMPSIVGAGMAIAVVLFGNPDFFNPSTPAPTNLGFFLNPLTTSHVVFAVASSVDIIIVWFLILLSIGLSRVSRNAVKAGSIFLTYFGAWMLLVMVKVGFALLARAG